jgi:hypothetical protein
MAGELGDGDLGRSTTTNTDQNERRFQTDKGINTIKFWFWW